MTTLPYDQMPTVIDERSTRMRAAVRDHLHAPVPCCPGWTGRDLVAHLGGVHRFWAAVVAGPSRSSPPEVDEQPRGDLLSWAEASTASLVAALRAAEPERPVWTWWGEPATAGAVARHQLQEAAVHAWDAQATAGHPEPLPEAVAADAVDEFLSISLGAVGRWPDPPATVSLVIPGSPAWSVRLSEAGRHVERGHPGGDTVLTGSGSDLLLVLYRRRPPQVLHLDGDRDLAARFLSWPNLD
jgi:uncharacterized protein (TIGR03083 family)